MKRELAGLVERQYGSRVGPLFGCMLIAAGSFLGCLPVATWLFGPGASPEIVQAGVASCIALAAGTALLWRHRRPSYTDIRIDAVGVHLVHRGTHGARARHFAPDQVEIVPHPKVLELRLPDDGVWLVGRGTPPAELVEAHAEIERMWAGRAIGTAADVPDALEQLLAQQAAAQSAAREP